MNQERKELLPLHKPCGFSSFSKLRLKGHFRGAKQSEEEEERDEALRRT